MAFNARVEYEGDGSNNAWTVSFSYLKKAHVKLFINGVEDTTFTWITDSSIAATSTPGDGDTVLIQRVTPRNALDTTIPASGTFRGQDINNQSTQALYVADEAYDEISVPTSGTLISGTPSDDQVAVFTSANTVEGTAGLTYDGSSLDVVGGVSSSGDVSAANITVTGTVDGVDIAARDADLTTAETKLAGIEASADVTDATNVAAAGAMMTGKHTVWVPALAMLGDSLSAELNEFGTGGQTPAIALDPATPEYLRFAIAMPKSWNESTVTFQVYWSNQDTSGDVVWKLEAGAFSNDDALTNTFGTQAVTDSCSAAAEDLLISAESSAITIGGTPAENDLVRFTFFRDAANGSDTATSDAWLLGIKIFITTDAGNDA